VTKVIFVGGAGRSGSTLVDRVIGQIPGYVSAGEVRTLWLAGLKENRLCGCGHPFSDCPFWQRVGQEAFGGWAHVDPDEIEAWLASTSYLDALRELRTDPQSRQPSIAGLAHVLDRLYAGISAAADGATIVDSSKGPRYGVTLMSLQQIDFRAIHLIRDSRGVAFSWSKEITRPDTPGRDVQMLRFSASRASARWIVQNIFMELLDRHVPSSQVRYETFAENPPGEIRRVLSELGELVPPGGLDFLDRGSVRLGPNHTVMGNPMRMAIGDIPLRADEAWRRNLPILPRTQVTALTWPLLIRYGYRV
jgi:hypothetical protein